MSWEQFKEEFTDKFVPASYRDAKAEEFFRLEQGTLSVIDYERIFLSSSDMSHLSGMTKFRRPRDLL